MVILLIGGGSMICLNCKNSFYVKRSFLTLFETKRYYICDRCRREYPLNPSVDNIPLQEYQLTIITLFNFKYPFVYHSYCEEYSKIVSWALLKYPQYFLFLIDKLCLSDYTLEILSFLADVEKKNILAICFQMKK